MSERRNHVDHTEELERLMTKVHAAGE